VKKASFWGKGWAFYQEAFKIRSGFEAGRKAALKLSIGLQRKPFKSQEIISDIIY
jgi:hypothetical protein